jgi:hypothetical protein
MIKHLRITIVAVILSLGLSTTASAAYVFVGSWVLGEGPEWTDNPDVYSGVETAALLFGAGDYAISTIDTNPANINFKTWLDGWADPDTYALSGNAADDTFSFDMGGVGYNDPGGFGTAYSAYVRDHFDGSDPTYTNFAFREVAVSAPASLALISLGLVGIAMRRRRTSA